METTKVLVIAVYIMVVFSTILYLLSPFIDKRSKVNHVSFLLLYTAFAI